MQSEEQPKLEKQPKFTKCSYWMCKQCSADNS